MKRSNPETRNREAQTRIHCYPHILLNKEDTAKALSSRACQTVASASPDIDNSNFYTSLGYLPYQELLANSIREIDLPRKNRLQWKLPNNTEQGESKSLLDVPITSEIQYRSALKHLSISDSRTSLDELSINKIFAHYTYTMQKTLVDQSVQTNLAVAPHILDTDEIAKVYTELSVQTSVTCVPDESLTNILPKLTANVSHTAVTQVTSLYVTEPNNDQPTETKNVTRQSKDSSKCGCISVSQTTAKFTTEFSKDVPFEERIEYILQNSLQILQTELINLNKAYSGGGPCLPANAIGEGVEENEISPEANENADGEDPGVTEPPEDAAEGDAAEGDAAEGDAAEGDAAEGDAAEGVAAEGDAAEDGAAEGDAAEGGAVEGDAAEGDAAEGDAAEGDAAEGDAAEGDAAEGDAEIVAGDNAEDAAPDEDKILATKSNDIIEEFEKYVTRTSTTREKLGKDNIPVSLIRDDITEETLRKVTTIIRRTENDVPSEESNVTKQVVVEEQVKRTITSTEGSSADAIESNVNHIKMQIRVPIGSNVTYGNALPSTSGADSQVIGDSKQAKRTSHILCECHPTDAGAAPPQLSPIQSRTVNRPASQQNGGYATSEALDKNVQFKSENGANNLLFRATISCPDCHIENRLNPTALDLREQVICLTIQPQLDVVEQSPTSLNQNTCPCSSKVNKFERSTSAKSCDCNNIRCQSKNSSRTVIAPKSIKSEPNSSYMSNNACPCKVNKNTNTDPYNTDLAKNIYSDPQKNYDAGQKFVQVSVDIDQIGDTSSQGDFSGRSKCPIHGIMAQGGRSNMKTVVTISVTQMDEDEDDQLKSQSFMYEGEMAYHEPYMEELIDATTGVQTDITLGDKLESDSLSSIPEAGTDPAKCDPAATEMPWAKIILPPAGSYSIKPTGKKAKSETPGKPPESGNPKEPTAPEKPSEEPVEVPPEEAAEVPPEEAAEVPPEEAAEVPPEEAAEVPPEEAPEESPEEVPAPAPTQENASEENEDDFVVPTKLLYEPTYLKSNEPYMEGLYKFFPDEDDSVCGPKTEIPWKDILLPTNCRIKKAKKCTCKTQSNKPQARRKPNPCECPTGRVMPSDAKNAQNEDMGLNIELNFGENGQKVVGKQSSAIVNIKPSTDCPFKSEMIPIQSSKCGAANSALLNVVNPQIPATKSCTSTTAQKVSEKTSKCSVKATLSLKKLGQPEQTVTKEMAVAPGNQTMKLQLPNEPFNVQVRVGSPDSSRPYSPLSKDTNEIFSPAKCICKDSIKPSTSKKDPVMAALEAYEAEMKPLRQALTQLQQKIQNLDMPEMKGCWCATKKSQQPQRLSAYGQQPQTIRSKVSIKGTNSQVTRAAIRIKPTGYGGSNNNQGTCPYFQPASFQTASPPSYYGAVPYPVPPPLQPYGPNYMPPRSAPQYGYRPPGNEYGRRRSSSSTTYSSSSQDKYNKKSKKDQLCSACGRKQNKKDIAMQASQRAMYPDHRGRSNQNKDKSCNSCTSNNDDKGGSKKYKIKTTISARSASEGNTTDYEENSQCITSDTDDTISCPALCPSSSKPSEKRRSKGRSKKKGKAKRDSSQRSAEDVLGQKQALKTGPSASSSVCPDDCNWKAQTSASGHTITKVSSRSRISIKFPFK